MSMKIRVEFKFEDMWVGWYWRNQTIKMPEMQPIKTVHTFDLWICIIPCFPLHITKVRVKSVEKNPRRR